MTRRAIVLAAALGAALATGCGGPDYDHTDIKGVIGSLGNEVDYTKVKVASGTLVTANITSWTDENRRMNVRIRAADPKVLAVMPVVTDGSFAFLGLAPGATTLDLEADGRTVLRLDAFVTEQPALP